jgi:Ca2+-binding RTX toxin-like protein
MPMVEDRSGDKLTALSALIEINAGKPGLPMMHHRASERVSWCCREEGGAIMAIRVRFLTDGNDVYRDGDLATEIHGLAGDDAIFGAGGNDVIYGGAGNDHLHGGNGADWLDGSGAGENHLYGDAGNDVLTARYLHEGYVQALGGAGNDTFELEADSCHVWGGIGDDRITVETYWTFPEERDTADAAFSYTAECTVFGEAGNDRIIAGSLADCNVDGGAGNDVIDAGVGRGVAWVLGGGGNDTLRVSASVSANGVALVDGGDGRDTISVWVDLPQEGPGGIGGETRGGAGDDVIVATLAAIDAKGDDGNDVLTGSNDLTHGADDSLYGLAGNDRLYGRAGNDKLGGGYGLDTMSGGTGNDIFDVNQGDSGVGLGRRDVIADFVHGQDRIDVISVDARAAVAGNQAFAFIGTRGFTTAGQLRYTYEGDHTVVQASTDADRAPELELQLSGHVVLAAGDFFL